MATARLALSGCPEVQNAPPQDEEGTVIQSLLEKGVVGKPKSCKKGAFLKKANSGSARMDLRWIDAFGCEVDATDGETLRVEMYTTDRRKL